MRLRATVLRMYPGRRRSPLDSNQQGSRSARNAGLADDIRCLTLAALADPLLKEIKNLLMQVVSQNRCAPLLGTSAKPRGGERMKS